MENNSGSILDKENLRKTKSRQQILEILRNSGPKTIDEIYQLAIAQGETMSMSTVYRTCETLAEKGVVQKSNLIEDGRARYEFAGISHRHHAVCMECHDIISIEDCPFGQFDELMESKYDFDVKSHSIEIYGYCRKCKLKQSEA
jgi:Fur family ferric uptake transcriptional regulator